MTLGLSSPTSHLTEYDRAKMGDAFTESHGIYKLQPLDHSQASLRLLKVLPDLSTDGYIQCAIIQTTVERETYSCLSYRWGEPLPTRNILVEGGTVSVRENLFDFLNTYRTKPQASGYIWIDALCIDQANLQERNHQVAQMGQIYYNAQLVLIWLGKSPFFIPIARSLQNHRDPSLEDYRTLESDSMISCLYNNEYWTRAWVTQEILLARSVLVIMDDQTILLSLLVDRLKFLFLTESEAFKQSHFSQYTSERDYSPSLDENSLILLMNRFRGKECSVPQDRVFSLLALCPPSSRVAVDYGQSPSSLFHSILAKQGDSLCACDVAQALDALELYHEDYLGACVEIDMTGVELAWPTDSPFVTGLKPRPVLDSHGGSICPAVERCITSVAQRAGFFPYRTPGSDDVTERSCAERLPFLYQSLPQEYAKRIIQASKDTLTIIEKEEGARSYKIRIALPLLAEDFSKDPKICPLVNRLKTWRWTDAPPKPGNYDKVSKASLEKVWEEYNKSVPHRLEGRISFEECHTTFQERFEAYEIIAKHEELPKEWTCQGQSFFFFLQDVRRGLQDQAPEPEADAGDTAAGRSELPSWYCGWGPCRFLSLV